MTPLLFPVWCLASSFSFSRTRNRSAGFVFLIWRAVARPTIPLPIMITSNFTGNFFLKNRTKSIGPKILMAVKCLMESGVYRSDSDVE